MDVLQQLVHLQKQRQPSVLITLVETRGSTPRKPGSRMLVTADGTTHGTIGGGRVEHAVIQAAKEALREGEPSLLSYQLTSELAMCCGGQMKFFVEPIMPRPPLLVFGCGHVGAALLQAASSRDLDLVAIDDLDENIAPDKLPFVHQRLGSYEADELNSLPFGPSTDIVIATREHSLDQKLLEFCLKQEFHYLGVIGSQRKANMQLERLRAKGFAEELLERVQCPMGLDISAQTPAEIAISICAQLISHRRSAPKTP